MADRVLVVGDGALQSGRYLFLIEETHVIHLSPSSHSPAESFYRPSSLSRMATYYYLVGLRQQNVFQAGAFLRHCSSQAPCTMHNSS